MNPAHPTLLIVDDEERIRRLITEFLEDYEEFQVQGADSAEEALEMLAVAPVNLCLVDLRLPGMSGEEFILAARSRGLSRRFLLHTGSVEHTLSPALREAGVTDRDVFYKPGDLDRLLERIREILLSGGE
jgi:two-component system, OmpR family, response regulator